MTMKYCPSDKRNVDTERGYNTVLLVLLILIGLIPGLIYYAISKKRCPICHTPQSMLENPRWDESTKQTGIGSSSA